MRFNAPHRRAVRWDEQSETHRRGRMVRTPRYKYVAFSEGRDAEMLFDLEADPGKTKNLAGNRATRDELKRHRVLLAQWIKQANDDFNVPP